MKCVKFTPDGQYVVGSGTWIPGLTRSTILMCRVSDGALVREFGVSHDVKSIALSADGRLLAAAVGGGDYVAAEMVRAFLDSAEYRRRFGR
ncbi:MAG: hypothetical protein LC795_14215 [Acidobacteria bacterium]|nr:hypothetical protein [Acidobacteriota bacterium]MCA1620434.1 hypothetical protein [Acidobacteriota bacterium]